MNAQTSEQRESAKDIAANDIHVRAGFRVVTSELLAGGPVEMEFFIENLGAIVPRLAVSGDRTRQRPGQFSFAATFEGSPIEDPMAGVPFMGGPEGVVQISSGSPWNQPFILNQFIRLEHTPIHLVPGSTGRLNLACRRPLTLATTDAAALSQDMAQVLAIDLAFNLHRDDVALRKLSARLFDEVLQGPVALRERPLALLLSMRSSSRTQIEALTRHADPSIAARSRQVLALFS